MKKEKKWSTKKKVIIAVLASVLSLFVILGATIGGFVLYSKAYSVKKGSTTSKNQNGLIMQGHEDQDRRSLYDKNGNKIVLRGVNAGNILLQEGWMSPFALEPKYDKNGDLVKDKDGNLSYPEFTQEDFLSALDMNPNLKDSKDELLDSYYKTFFSEDDFRIVKEELKFNCIRLPFYWRNILNDDYSRKEESVAFSYLDWFLENCSKYELYLILDLHGAPQSQNGYEHSGIIQDKAMLYNDKKAMEATINLWGYVSDYYTNRKPELGSYIATYDLLNEPQTEKNTPEAKECFDLQDKIYQRIRKNNDKHLITIESVWDFSVSPDPKEYGWENIMYEYHHYNWNNKIVTMDAFMAYHDMKHIGADYDVPIFIGEFTYFENRNSWKTALVDWYGKRDYSWTIWSYKCTVTGYWTTSWGVYTVNLNLDTEKEEKKCNVSTCTKEEFLSAVEKTKTENCSKGTLYEVIQSYQKEFDSGASD